VKTRPLVPAAIAWGDDGTPISTTYGDVYHARAGALAQANHVFLAGNDLPGRWAGRDHFVIVETGFGLGNNFIATWDAWRGDPRRCGHLHYLAIEAHPARLEDLRRAHAASPHPKLAQGLIDSWPPAVPGLHTIDLDDEGRVRLLLAFGDIADLLPALACRADAFYLDGFAPSQNPQMWRPQLFKALARLAAPGATAATWCVAGEVTRSLVAAGFEVSQAPGFGGKRSMTCARFAPRFVPRVASGAVETTRPGRAVVIGAGVAGASVAAALAALGVDVEVLEQAPDAATGASGNPAGLFHAIVHADDGPHARLLRAGAAVTHRLLRGKHQHGQLPAGLDGLLHLVRDGDLARMRRWVEAQGLPADWVQALDAKAASALAGVTISSPAWWHRHGGWLAPAALVRRLLTHPRITLRPGVEVHKIERRGDRWTCFDDHGRLLAEAPTLVVAAAEGTQPLLQALGGPGWPETSVVGQLSLLPPGPPQLRLPIAGDGYAIPLPDGSLLCGATRRAGDDLSLRDEDHHTNFERLRRLTGIVAPTGTGSVWGRTGRRQQSGDRLPVAGAVPLPEHPWPSRRDQPHWAPRMPGLHVLAALGGRGLTLAPLLGRLVAAQITATPQPLERDLVDAVDPARFLVRAARRAAADG